MRLWPTLALLTVGMVYDLALILGIVSMPQREMRLCGMIYTGTFVGHF